MLMFISVKCFCFSFVCLLLLLLLLLCVCVLPILERSVVLTPCMCEFTFDVHQWNTYVSLLLSEVVVVEVAVAVASLPSVLRDHTFSLPSEEEGGGGEGGREKEEKRERERIPLYLFLVSYCCFNQQLCEEIQSNDLFYVSSHRGNIRQHQKKFIYIY